MIYFNCGCFGHVKANCVHQKKDRPTTTSHESAQTATGNTDVDKPNSETVAMETYSQIPISITLQLVSMVLGY